MINKIITLSIQYRMIVLLAAVAIFGFGVYAIKNTAVDAIPDLSDVQVIIKTPYPGQAPQVVEDQITYPLSTAMLSVPKAITVRAYSFFGDSYVYVIFEEGTDIYWARARVLEYLSQASSRLPAQAKPAIGPDATGVGWVYQYALIDRSGNHSLAQLRTLQDWFLKFELQTVAGVAEVATVGGMVKQYQVVVDPNKLRAFNIPLAHISMAIQRANREVGASVIEMAEAEYMVRANGYLSSIADIQKIPLGLSQASTPIVLGDIAEISEGPQMRRGIAELNGEGEVVGGIVVMRYEENAQATIAKVKEKMEQLTASLPAGVEIVEVYDRSSLISAAVKNLYEKLGEELLVVALVCALFLFHFRSSLVVVVSLPIGVICALIVMYLQGVSANIMSLGGIAIAIGAMVDGAIVMIENVHKHLESSAENEQLSETDRWALINTAAAEVGRPLFFALLIITVSFVPVFALEAQEGKLFSPLAYTKTYAMAAAAGLAITLVPVLMGYLIRGKIVPENRNPVNRGLMALYKPVVRTVLKYPKLTLFMALLITVSAIWPLNKIGSEFMPALDEGDLMYMPTSYAGISIGTARKILQQTNKLIMTVPEVKTAFGKVGRAETATDPAPLTMIETVIQFKPQSEWRPGMTHEKVLSELKSAVQLPGLANSWVMPIKTRIDMLATGIKTPVGIKVAGADMAVIEQIGRRLEEVLLKVDGTASVYSERVAGGRYIKVDIDRSKAARFGLNIADVQDVVSTAIGGVNVTETIEGIERFPVNLRYPQRYRDSSEQLKLLPIVTESGEQIALADVASVYIDNGPPAIKSENARLNGWTYVDIENRDLGSYVAQAKQVVKDQLVLPAGYSLTWAGQYEYLERAKNKLLVVVPVVVAIIVLLLYANFRRWIDVLMILLTLPLAMVGSLWFMFWQQYDFSVAVVVGFIALAGVSVEIGLLMLAYLHQAVNDSNTQLPLTRDKLLQAVVSGAGLRVRPIVMTVMATVIGLLPIMLGAGTGSGVMQRIAGPMIGGMITSLLLSLLILPVSFYLWYGRNLESK